MGNGEKSGQAIYVDRNRKTGCLGGSMRLGKFSFWEKGNFIYLQ